MRELSAPTAGAAALLLAIAATPAMAAGELTANAGATNNYLWRGLTQTTNEPAVQGGIDYVAGSGFYVGTWVSNVQYAADDAFSYENDLYVGYAGEAGPVSYDFGYLYYNYDDEAEFDFGEVYGTLGVGGFSFSAFVLANTEADEEAGVDIIGRDYDFGFGQAFYLSADYGIEVGSGIELGFHVGYHDGDFVDAFNFADGTTDYVDYNISLAKGGFGFMVSMTDLDDSPIGLQNDDIRFVVSYSMDFDLN